MARNKNSSAMIYNRGRIQNQQQSLSAGVLCRRFLWKLNRSGTGCVFLAFVLLSCVGCQTSSRAPLPNQPAADTPVTLSPGDVIKLTFPGASDLNQSQKVR